MDWSFDLALFTFTAIVIIAVILVRMIICGYTWLKPHLVKRLSANKR